MQSLNYDDVFPPFKNHNTQCSSYLGYLELDFNGDNGLNCISNLTKKPQNCTFRHWIGLKSLIGFSEGLAAIHLVASEQTLPLGQQRGSEGLLQDR